MKHRTQNFCRRGRSVAYWVHRKNAMGISGHMRRTMNLIRSGNWGSVPAVIVRFSPLNVQQNGFKKIYRAKTPSTQSKRFTYFSEPWRLCVPSALLRACFARESPVFPIALFRIVHKFLKMFARFFSRENFVGRRKYGSLQVCPRSTTITATR